MIKYHIGTFMACMILFYSCTKDKAAIDASTQKTTANRNAAISDEDVFRGVMFLDGPVADHLGDYSSMNLASYMTPAQKDAATDLENEIIAAIEDESSSYMADFRSKITSGDFDKVKAAMIDGGNMIKSKLTGVSNADYQSQANSFMDTYKITSSSTLTDIKTAVQQQAAMQTNCVGVELIVVVVVVIALVGVWVGNNISNNPDQTSTYLNEAYFSAITVSLDGL